MVEDRARTLMNSFITTRLDSCRSVLYGLPIKGVIEAAETSKHNCARHHVHQEHTTPGPVPGSLHWLPITARRTSGIQNPLSLKGKATPQKSKNRAPHTLWAESDLLQVQPCRYPSPEANVTGKRCPTNTQRT
ncbi:hypothetical protein ElyMa_003826000 [Elysia marginata]|uniref:Uncharacterized protein n=1 Tax=Elysia marginata TaxID=1093978 RepID=A0AAV4FHT5_9GAST|nr:hypothetical protein ElyMa_003826000 [Elysia marginata]